MRGLFSRKWTKERLGPMALQAAPWVALAALAAFWPRKRGDAQPGLSVQAHAEPESFEVAEPGRGRMAAAPLSPSSASPVSAANPTMTVRPASPRRLT